MTALQNYNNGWTSESYIPVGKVQVRITEKIQQLTKSLLIPIFSGTTLLCTLLQYLTEAVNIYIPARLPYIEHSLKGCGVNTALCIPLITEASYLLLSLMASMAFTHISNETL